MNTSGAAYDSFTVAAERLTGRYGDKPFCTWYDDHRDERVELSYRTFGNWVAKTANLLVDELGAEPGDQVGVLADHWQVPVLLAACWRAGLGVVSLDRSGGQQAPPRTPPLVAAFVHEARLEHAPVPEATPVVALTADPLGRPGGDLGRAQSFSRIVPSMADAFDGGTDPPGDALTVGDGTATMGQLLASAAALAARTSLGDTDRLLSGRPLLDPAGAAAGLLAPLACGAGVVLVSNFNPARFWRRVADERVTVAVLDPVQAVALRHAAPPPTDRDHPPLRVLLDD
ncbi:MAG TPA: TIGR03089 family protein [Actinomycetota bacterium]|nr:TIGR03089 family protein [Actinomycetota bacterium]